MAAVLEHFAQYGFLPGNPPPPHRLHRPVADYPPVALLQPARGFPEVFHPYRVAPPVLVLLVGSVTAVMGRGLLGPQKKWDGRDADFPGGFPVHLFNSSCFDNIPQNILKEKLI